MKISLQIRIGSHKNYNHLQPNRILGIGIALTRMLSLPRVITHIHLHFSFIFIGDNISFGFYYLLQLCYSYFCPSLKICNHCNSHSLVDDKCLSVYAFSYSRLLISSLSLSPLPFIIVRIIIP